MFNCLTCAILVGDHELGDTRRSLCMPATITLLFGFDGNRLASISIENVKHHNIQIDFVWCDGEPYGVITKKSPSTSFMPMNTK